MSVDNEKLEGIDSTKLTLEKMIMKIMILDYLNSYVHLEWICYIVMLIDF